jgi:hypothetical protein
MSSAIQQSMRSFCARSATWRAIGTTLAVALVCAFTTAMGVTSAADAAQVLRPLSASNYSTERACTQASAGRAACFAQLLVPKTPAARARRTPIGITIRPGVKANGPAGEGAYGLRPGDVHAAYNLPTEAKSPQTIALVDAYNDPTAEEDLRVYDEEFGLSACTAANHCFTKLNQEGRSSPLPETEPGWALEISLDVEAAHAVCQNCHIMLVEATSSSWSDIKTAEQTAVERGATEVSNSYGGGDMPETGSYNHPGVVITASSGDWGYQEPASYPAASPNVVAVGGTTLGLEERHWSSEKVWSGGGSGCSPFAMAQPWQQSVSNSLLVGCGSQRAVADVAAVADPYTGLAVYDTTGYAGWQTVGGTSLSSPVIASTFALAGGSNGVAYPAQTLYAHEGESGLRDTLEGSNGFCGELLICNAAKGYDGPTGVGTPNGISAFVPGTSVPVVTGVAPAEGTTAGGTSVTVTGINLAGAHAVAFGGTPATITSDSSTSITAISPAHGAGRVNVTVTNSSGSTSAESSADQFDYVIPIPRVTGVAPSEGTTGGGSTVTITGSGLDEAAAVDFGGAGATIVGRSGGSLIVTSPPHGPGPVDVTVRSGEGATSPISPGDRFTYIESTTLRMSNVRWTPRVFTTGRRPRLYVTLNEAATVIVSIDESMDGHLVHGSCVLGRRSHRSCTAALHTLTLRLPAVAGANVFTLRLGRLRPGSYVAGITAQTANERSPDAVKVSFSVRERRR